MSMPPINDDLARAHEIFRKNHDAGRQRLLETLSDDVSRSPTIRRRSMRSVIRVLASRPLLCHWPSKLAVAAALFVALTVGFYASWHSLGQTAYALDDLPNRLLEVKSIYMTGWMFQPTGMSDFPNPWTIRRIGIGKSDKLDGTLGQDNAIRPKYPIKLFVERPDCYWHTWYSFSGPDAIHKDVRVQSGYTASKGTKTLSVSTSDKTADDITAVETSVAAIQTELSTEMFFQILLPQQWLSGHLHDFVKTGTETVNNVPCDVYEHPVGNRKKRLWLDPQTGLPVKIASYDIDKAGQEFLIQLIDHVEVNIPASATGLSFDPPEGYQVKKTPQPKNANLLQAIRNASAESSSRSNDKKTVDREAVDMGLWNSFNIDDKAVLFCWYCETKSDSKTAGTTVLPEFLLAGTHPCDHKEIASVDLDGHHWTWSLVWPKKSGERIENDGFSVVHHSKQSGSLSLESFPLRLREDRLKAILEEVQRLTKTSVPGSYKPFTLDMLRTQLGVVK